MRVREAARARVAQSKAAARNTRVRGSNRRKDKPLLDPHGLYGTRTAQRMRNAQRRQTAQKFLLAASVVALLLLLFSRWETTRVGTLKAHDERRFGGEILSPIAQRADQIAWIERSGIVRVLDVRTQRARRIAQIELPASSAPLLLQNTVVVASEDGVIRNFDTRDNKLVWTRKTGATNLRLLQITSSNDKKSRVLIAASDSGQIAVIQIDNGATLWQRDLRATIGDALVTVNGKLWVPLGANLRGRGGLMCLDLANGSVLKSHDLNAAHIAALAVGDATRNRNRVISAGDNGALFCFDGANGKRVWKTFAQPTSSSSPDAAVVLRGDPLFKTYSWGERVFIGASDGALRAFDARNGRELWKFEARSVLRKPASLRHKVDGIERDFIVTTDNQGVVRVLDAQSGALQWQAATSSVSQGAFVLKNTIWNIASDGRVEQFQLPE